MLRKIKVGLPRPHLVSRHSWQRRLPRAKSSDSFDGAIAYRPWQKNRSHITSARSGPCEIDKSSLKTTRLPSIDPSLRKK